MRQRWRGTWDFHRLTDLHRHAQSLSQSYDTQKPLALLIMQGDSVTTWVDNQDFKVKFSKYNIYIKMFISTTQMSLLHFFKHLICKQESAFTPTLAHRAASLNPYHSTTNKTFQDQKQHSKSQADILLLLLNANRSNS